MSHEYPQGAVVGVLRAEASATVTRPRFITGRDFAAALVAAGVIPEADSVQRIVIDVKDAGEPVIIHIERIGDERLLDVVRHLDGIEVRTGRPAGGSAAPAGDHPGDADRDDQPGHLD